MKRIVIICFFIVTGLNAFAQVEGGARFGLQLSPQLSWMTAGDGEIKKNGSNFGFAYGLLLDINIPTNYAFSTGLSISYEGGGLNYIEPTQFNSFPDSTFNAGTSIDYRLGYIEIPLTIKLMTNEIGYVTYFGQFGLLGGINIRSKADITSLNGNINTENEDFGPDVTPGNVSLLVGGGLEYNFTGNTSLLVGLQFTNGFVDVTDNPKDFVSKSALNHFRLQLGVFF